MSVHLRGFGLCYLKPAGSGGRRASRVRRRGKMMLVQAKEKALMRGHECLSSFWRPQGDLNPCRLRERVTLGGLYTAIISFFRRKKGAKRKKRKARCVRKSVPIPDKRSAQIKRLLGKKLLGEGA